MPLEERVRRAPRARDPRAQLLDEESATRDLIARVPDRELGRIYRLGDPPDYEPLAETSARRRAAREGRRPEEVALDWLLEDDGKALLFAPLAHYVDHDHEAIREMICHPAHRASGCPTVARTAASSATPRSRRTC